MSGGQISARASRCIAGLARGGLVAPLVLDGPVNWARFDADVDQGPAPALKPGQIVIADVRSTHKSPDAQTLLRAQDNDPIFLPPYSVRPEQGRHGP